MTTNDQSADEPSRPSEHGGGEPSQPIAGDPSSFPSDAELARTLCWQRSRGSLSTVTTDGFPYGSLVSYAPDERGAPVVLISEMAEHTVNLHHDARASVLVTASSAEADGDPLGLARLTLVGRMQAVDDPAQLRDHYLERHPSAAYYIDFTDFGFWRLEVEQCRYVGGFGHMSWIPGAGYGEAEVDPIAAVADAVVEHMNDDHSEANLLYAKQLAELPDAIEATMTGIDRYGVTLRVNCPPATRLARVPFDEPLVHADQARPAVIALLEQARSTVST